MAWALPARHMATPSSAALDSVSASTIGIGGDVEADFGGQGLHGGVGADEGGLDEAGGGGFDRAAQGNVGERPDDGGGDGGQVLAALDELMKDVDSRPDGRRAGRRQRLQREGRDRSWSLHASIFIVDGAGGGYGFIFAREAGEGLCFDTD